MAEEDPPTWERRGGFTPLRGRLRARGRGSQTRQTDDHLEERVEPRIESDDEGVSEAPAENPRGTGQFGLVNAPLYRALSLESTVANRQRTGRAGWIRPQSSLEEAMLPGTSDRHHRVAIGRGPDFNDPNVVREALQRSQRAQRANCAGGRTSFKWRRQSEKSDGEGKQ